MVDQPITLKSLGVSDLNEDIIKYKGTDWKNMPVADWFHFAKANLTFREPGVSYDELFALYTALMTQKRPMTILETGQCLGTTTRFFVLYTQKYGGHHTSCEIKRRELYVNAMKELGLEDKYTTIGNSMRAPWDKHIDFLFIDSEHCITDALGEYMRFRVFLDNNSIVGFHDSENCIGVTRTIEIITNEVDDLELVSKSENVGGAGVVFFKVRALGAKGTAENLRRRIETTEALIKERARRQEAGIK